MARILIVDDEVQIQTIMQDILEEDGHTVQLSSNGEDALALIQKEHFDLVLLDVMMPKESGIFMYRELKKDPELKDIPVIMVSALSKKTFFHSQKVLDEYEGGQIDEPAAYIEKPPEPEELLQVIKRILP